MYKPHQMGNILQNVLVTQQKMQEKGIKFCILVPPNKENIYSEFMPDNFVQAKASRTDLLVEYLVENGGHVVYPKRELLTAKSVEQLYYYYDTHWNQLGSVYVDSRFA